MNNRLRRTLVLASTVNPGDVFRDLTVTSITYSNGNNGMRVPLLLCVCSCGSTITVTENEITTGRRSSCGCQKAIRLRLKSFVHGDCKNNHERTAEYSAWAEMKRRCLDPARRAYVNYGGRGISVCARWIDDYPSFLADMGRKPSRGHSLERKDTNGNYEPDNCVWATRIQQNRNRRNTVILKLNGVSKTQQEWADETGIGYKAIQRRLDRGWSIERALTEPAFVGKNQKFLGLDFHRAQKNS